MGSCSFESFVYMGFPMHPLASCKQVMNGSLSILHMPACSTAFNLFSTGVLVVTGRLQDLAGYGVALAVGKEFASAFPDRTFQSPLVDLMVKSGRNGTQ